MKHVVNPKKLKNALRRRLLTRCDWCGGRSRPGDAAWATDGRGAAFHVDCASIAHAKSVCLCGPDGGPWPHELEDYSYGTCASCGKFRGYLSSRERQDPDYPGLHTNRILASVPDGQRDPVKSAVVAQMWRHYRGEAS